MSHSICAFKFEPLSTVIVPHHGSLFDVGVINPLMLNRRRLPASVSFVMLAYVISIHNLYHSGEADLPALSYGLQKAPIGSPGNFGDGLCGAAPKY